MSRIVKLRLGNNTMVLDLSLIIYFTYDYNSNYIKIVFDTNQNSVELIKCEEEQFLNLYTKWKNFYTSTKQVEFISEELEEPELA